MGILTIILAISIIICTATILILIFSRRDDGLSHTFLILTQMAFFTSIIGAILSTIAGIVLCGFMGVFAGAAYFLGYCILANLT